MEYYLFWIIMLHFSNMNLEFISVSFFSPRMHSRKSVRAGNFARLELKRRTIMNNSALLSRFAKDKLFTPLFMLIPRLKIMSQSNFVASTASKCKEDLASWNVWARQLKKGTYTAREKCSPGIIRVPNRQMERRQCFGPRNTVNDDAVNPACFTFLWKHSAKNSSS